MHPYSDLIRIPESNTLSLYMTSPLSPAMRILHKRKESAKQVQPTLEKIAKKRFVTERYFGPKHSRTLAYEAKMRRILARYF